MDTYGLLGRKLGHSFSKEFFTRKFQEEGINAEYVNFEIPSINCLKDVLQNNPDIKGLNVTVPYKEEVIACLDTLDADAAAIGAVNVIKTETDANGKKTLQGFNTDHIGFTDSLVPHLHSHHTHALILGSGGASRAVEHALIQLGILPLIVSRNPESTRHRRSPIISYSQLTADIISSCTVIINTTPLGMYPDVNTYPFIPYHLINKQHLAYDLVYNPQQTQFMQKCSARGATCVCGLDMLHIQALRSWDIWTGIQ